MKDSRLAIQEYIDQNFKGYELTHDSSITKATEPRLKYNRIDRYSVKVISSKALGLFIDYINQCKCVELYFAFGFLCIGFMDREYGETMRLDAFTNSHKDQLGSDFVTGQCTAAPGPVDKEFVTPELVDLSNQADKEFVLDPNASGAAELDKVPGVQA